MINPSMIRLVTVVLAIIVGAAISPAAQPYAQYQLTDDSTEAGHAFWSPDGTRLAYGSDRGGSGQVSVAVLEPFTRVTEGPHVNDNKGATGACWIDYDGDGYLDIYVPAGSIGGPDDNSLYRNNGDGTYSEVTGLPIVSDNTQTTSATWADYDNDDDLDLCFVTGNGANMLYDSDGAGGFTAVPDLPIDDAAVFSSTVSWVDINRDDYLDLFIGNAAGSIGYTPHRNFVFLGDGNSFAEVTEGVVVTEAKHTYGASWSDYDDDGYPDLVAPSNVGHYTDLYHNDGNMSFTDMSSSAVCLSIANAAGSSWADFDNDGDMDLFVGGSAPGPGYLYQNNGDGTFSEVTGHGLGVSLGRAYGGSWGDFDNDGDQDILVYSNIYSYPSPDYDSSMGVLFENNLGTFTALTDTLILFGDRITKAVIWGDSDRDGDLDIFASTAQLYLEPADNLFFENNGNGNNWITVKPVGIASNRSAVGAKVRLKAVISGSPVWQMREIMTQTGTGCQFPLEAHFGLGDAAMVDSLLIEWPSGGLQILIDVGVNQFLTVTESCCLPPTVGDIDQSGGVDITDISVLVDNQFLTLAPLICKDEGDIDFSGVVDITDLSLLIDNQFLSLTPLPSCP